MASGRMVDYLGKGLKSARPTTLNLTTGALGVYFATDEPTKLGLWTGAAWVDFSGGGGGAGVWGSITGTLADQLDLKAALDARILDAPNNANNYVRKGGAWVIMPTPGAPAWGTITGTLSAQTDLQNALNALADAIALKIGEAPNDGKKYGRQSLGWAEITENAATWGNIGGTLADQTDLSTAISSKLSDAPNDGNYYARRNGAWAVAPSGGGTAWGSITGTLSAQTDLATALNAKLSDAPNDGQEYVRKNAAWAVASGGSGGSSKPELMPRMSALPAFSGSAYNVKGMLFKATGAFTIRGLWAIFVPDVTGIKTMQAILATYNDTTNTIVNILDRVTLTGRAWSNDALQLTADLTTPRTFASGDFFVILCRDPAAATGTTQLRTSAANVYTNMYPYNVVFDNVQSMQVRIAALDVSNGTVLERATITAPQQMGFIAP